MNQWTQLTLTRRGKAAGDMTQYLAPINSLASLALGYWFGAEK